jgi:ketosteroid isomerase-like protein
MPDSSTPETQPIPRDDIEALVAEIAWCLDHGQADRVPHLFTDAGVFASPLATLSGRAELVAGFGARARQTHTTRHVHANLRLVADGPERLRGTTILTVYRADGPEPGPARPFMVGDCDDVYERGADGCWRVAERRIAPTFLSLPKPGGSGA